MIKIAHRALLYGPDPALENRPEEIEKCLYMGYDVEIDVWHDGASGWWLGHDKPVYPVSRSFLERPGLWLHCKNVHAAGNATDAMHFFWHQNDDYTITNRGVIWVYPGQPLPTARASVWVMPEKNSQIGKIDAKAKKDKVYAICTDYLNGMYPVVTGVNGRYWV